MKRRLFLFLASTAWAATLIGTATAQEYSTGTGQCGKCGRGPAILTPVEAFGVHPPGPDPAYNRHCFFRRWRFTFKPYYAPVSPTASSVRWKPWCYFPLLPWYTPYYITYCPHRLCNPEPQPYGSDGGWGEGPPPECPIPKEPNTTPLRYGAYTSILTDDTVFWDMGGNGLVPYGAPRPPHYGSPDLVDSIQTVRAQGGFGPGCAGFAPVADLSGAPATLPPAETEEKKGSTASDKQGKEASNEETSPPAK
jgi:hypothetical protein